MRELAKITWLASRSILRKCLKVTFVFKQAVAAFALADTCELSPTPDVPCRDFMSNWLLCVEFCTGFVLQARQIPGSAVCWEVLIEFFEAR